MRVEFSINAVKTKSLRAAINPKAWTHHCITYEKAIYKRNFPNEMKGSCLILSHNSSGDRRGQLLQRRKAQQHRHPDQGQEHARVSAPKYNKGCDVELANLNSNSPRFPGDGILILGQEQETLCGGFDDYDSLSGDLSDFNVRIDQRFSAKKNCDNVSLPLKKIWNRRLSDEELEDLASCHTENHHARKKIVRFSI